MSSKILTLAAVSTLTGLVACAASPSDGAGSSDQAATADAVSIIRRTDGRFDVTCADGSRQVLTSAQINMDLACGGPAHPPVVGDDDDDLEQPVSCLNTTPIDQTQFAYTKAKPAERGKCTAREMQAIGAYYKNHVADADFTTAAWQASVSAGCAACVFTEEDATSPATAWTPIITEGDQLSDVNRGGCIEQVSGSEACGRAYHQYQTCLLQACLVDCKTQTDFNACRGDQRVLTTSCKNAAEAIRSSCGANINRHEAACKSTTYTFDGPIKVGCVTGVPGSTP